MSSEFSWRKFCPSRSWKDVSVDSSRRTREHPLCRDGNRGKYGSPRGEIPQELVVREGAANRERPGAQALRAGSVSGADPPRATPR